MRVSHLVTGLLAAVIVVGLVYVKTSREDSPPAQASPDTVRTSEEKARIREFWKVYGRAGELKRAGAWQQAIELYRQAIELDAEHEDALYNLANCHFEVGDFEEALVYLHRLVKVNPLSHRAHHQIGLIHTCPEAGDLFDLKAARAELTRAFEINKEETGSLLRLGEIALVEGDGQRCFELLSLANRSNFRAVEGYYLRAYLRWKDGREGEAVALLKEAVTQSRKPVVVAGVPGEGDTRPGSSLPPTTVTEKRLLRPAWKGLPSRYPEGAVAVQDLSQEFADLEAHLQRLASLANMDR